MGSYQARIASWPQLSPHAPPTPRSTNKGPGCLSQQGTHTGNPLRNRVEFLKGGQAVLGKSPHPGPPYTGKQPTAQGQALGAGPHIL